MQMQKDQNARTRTDHFSDQLRKPEAVLFWEYLDRNSDVRQVLTGLEQAGCDPLIVMTLAALYCTGDKLHVKEITKQATGYTPQQLAALSERLLQAAKDVQALNECAMPGGVTLGKLIRVLGGGDVLEKALAPILPSEQLDFEFTRLPVVLAAYAVFLKGWPHPAYRNLIADRSAGRDYFLAQLALYIEAVLGHTNWNALSAVLKAVHFACGHSDEITTDAASCQRTVEHFQRRNPELYASIKQRTQSGMRKQETQSRA
jgi:hypothetical protein